jgi:hypothetical protein
VKKGKFNLGDGWTAEVNDTKIHYYQESAITPTGAAGWVAMTDHKGNVTRISPKTDRSTVHEKYKIVANLAGIKVPNQVTDVPAKQPSAKRAANYRCPNPRDCGDPTCDGGCGY